MDYLKELDYLIEKFGNHNELVEKLLFIKDFCVVSINEINYLRNQLEDKQSNEVSEEVYSYEESQELKAFTEATKKENIDLKIQCEVMNADLEVLEELDNKLVTLNQLSINNFLTNHIIRIDICNNISEEAIEQNDNYNKILFTSTFVIHCKINENWCIVDNHPSVIITIKKNVRHYALFDDPNKKYIIVADSVTHQLITSDKMFQEFIANTQLKRMFTFIEYNESYNTKHAKNFNFNCDQLAVVLFPYIWSQLSLEDRIKLNNFIKIVVIFKFDDMHVITNEFRFVIIYEETNGDLKRYVVDKNVKFVTNISFNFIEENLYCCSLSKIENIDQLYAERRNVQINFKNNLEQAWYNNVTPQKIEIINSKGDGSKIEYKFDFNFNQTITSDNLSNLFDAIKKYCRFEIRNKRTLFRKNGTSEVLKTEYRSIILNHYVSEFTDEEFDRLILSKLISRVYPDTVIVSY